VPVIVKVIVQVIVIAIAIAILLQKIKKLKVSFYQKMKYIIYMEIKKKKKKKL
jgi:hypothetical protein